MEWCVDLVMAVVFVLLVLATVALVRLCEKL
jgi:hypothetical protein